MIGHLGRERSLQNGFGQLFEQTVLPDDILGLLVVGEQLIDQLLVDAMGSPIFFLPWSFTQFSPETPAFKLQELRCSGTPGCRLSI
jgi:hypothetical protein